MSTGEKTPDSTTASRPDSPSHRDEHSLRVEGGTPATQEFYERSGWHHRDGQLEDRRLFGVREDGPIRQSLHRQRIARIAETFNAFGRPLEFVELGCGGNPELAFRESWNHYTGVDFSKQGLKVSAGVLEKAGIPHTLVASDITDLPFPDCSFDALYCGHVLYHIDSSQGQAQAVGESIRVLKPGGVAVFVVANPYPLLFPLRLLKRSAATLLRRPGSGPLPYLPLPPGWFRKTLGDKAEVEIETYAMASTWFNQHVSEFRLPGRLTWWLHGWLETRCRKASVRLGNYVIVFARKPA